MSENKLDLKRIQENWDQLAKMDPLWAILVDPDKKGGKWSELEFFKTGEREIREVMEYINSLGLHIRRHRALDFWLWCWKINPAAMSIFR